MERRVLGKFGFLSFLRWRRGDPAHPFLLRWRRASPAVRWSRQVISTVGSIMRPAGTMYKVKSNYMCSSSGWALRALGCALSLPGLLKGESIFSLRLAHVRFMRHSGGWISRYCRSIDSNHLQFFKNTCIYWILFVKSELNKIKYSGGIPSDYQMTKSKICADLKSKIRANLVVKRSLKILLIICI